jgi:quinoprotein glucose dehydrogenase
MQEDARYCFVGPLLTVWIAFAVLAMGQSFAKEGPGEWSNYGNDPGGMRFSPLTQISRKNVSKLKAAWVFHTGDISDGNGRPRSGFESTPVVR